MSYILDALQRADAERERGHVPRLNSQVVPPAGRQPARARRGSPVLPVLAAVLLLLAAAAALWWWLSPRTVAPATATAPAITQAPTPAAPPPAAVAEAPPAPRMAAPPAAEPVQPILAPPREEPARRPASASPPASAATPAAPAPVTAASQPAAAAAAPATPPDAAPVRSFAELSPEARAALPPVNVSGSTYSKNPALRMLIVNGKVLQEGQEIAPGFKLETIGQRSAVLNHNGLRYSIGY